MFISTVKKESFQRQLNDLYNDVLKIKNSLWETGSFYNYYNQSYLLGYKYNPPKSIFDRVSDMEKKVDLLLKHFKLEIHKPDCNEVLKSVEEGKKS